MKRRFSCKLYAPAVITADWKFGGNIPYRLSMRAFFFTQTAARLPDKTRHGRRKRQPHIVSGV